MASESGVAPPRFATPKSMFVNTSTPACGLVPGNRPYCCIASSVFWPLVNTSPKDTGNKPENSSPPGVIVNGPRCDSSPPKYHEDVT